MNSKVIKVDCEKPDIKIVKRVADVLDKGGLVIIPTETVYGIAANCHYPPAMERLHKVKKRPKHKPFSLAIGLKEDLEYYAKDIPVAAYKLVDRFWPGPLTIILPAHSGSGVGLRMPDHPFISKLMQELKYPLALPSANLSGKPPAKNIEQAMLDLADKVDLAVDAGESKIGIESTVVDLRGACLKILRQGAISETEIKQVTEKKNILFVCTGNSCRSVMAEALLKKKLKEKGRSDIEVSSAGVAMLQGMPTTPETAKLLKDEGVDISGHRSRKVTPLLVKKSDLILVMERGHEKRISEWVPQAKNRLFLLKEFAKIDSEGSLDIIDPIGKPLSYYQIIFNLIKEAVDRVAEAI